MLVRIRLVVLDLGAAGFVSHSAQAESHLFLFHVDLDDLEFVLLALLELGRRAVFTHCFRDMAEAFNALRYFNESAELRGAEYLAVHVIADAMLGKKALPHIGLQLLDSERETAILRLDTENDSLHLFALLHYFRRMLDALGPAKVRDVNQAVDAVFDFNEGAKVGQVAHAAFNHCAGGIALREVLPWILEKLLHAKRNAAVGRIHAENDSVDLIPRLD